MITFGVYKPFFPTNDFVELIFKDNNNLYYVQKEKSLNVFEFIQIDIDTDFEIIEVKQKKEYSFNIDYEIIAYINEKNELLIGTFDEIKSELVVILSNSNDIFAKLPLSEELRLGGLTRKIEHQISNYFIDKDLDFDIQTNKRNIKYFNEIDSVLMKKIIFFEQILELDKKLSWKDVITTEIDNKKREIIIDDYKFNLSDVFDYIYQIQDKYKELLYSIIDLSEVRISYEVNNRPTESVKRKINHKDEISLSKLKEDVIEKNRISW